MTWAGLGRTVLVVSTTSHRIQPFALRPCISGTHDQAAGRIGSNQVMKEHYGPLITPYEMFRCNLPAEGFLPTPVGEGTGLIRDDRFHPRGGDFGVDEKAWQGGSRHTWPCHGMVRATATSGVKVELELVAESSAVRFHGLGFEAATMKSYEYDSEGDDSDYDDAMFRRG
ncbi:unnamed protein product [Penicillium pancosmium]